MSEFEEMNALVDASVLLFADSFRLSRKFEGLCSCFVFLGVAGLLLRLRYRYKRRGKKNRDLAGQGSMNTMSMSERVEVAVRRYHK